MKTFLILVFLTITFISLNAQSFDRKVFASAGKDANNGITGTSGMLMAYTIGEPMIYRGANTSFSLNNGFIQPIGVSAIAPPAPSGLILANGDLVVYPNPFGIFITVNGPEENEDEIKVQLIDLQGKIILDQQILPKYHKLEVPEYCAPGTYLLNFYTLQGQFLQQTKMIKMNIDINN